MADGEIPSIDKPLRPGGTIFDPTLLPHRGLLRSSSRTEALTKAREIEGNLGEFAFQLQRSLTGTGQGVHVQVDPELPVLQSRVRPFLGKVGDPALVDEIQKVAKSIQEQRGTMSPSLAREMGRDDRLVRATMRRVQAIDPDMLGHLITVGLQTPRANPLLTREAMVMGAVLLSSSIVPESASMDLTKGWGLQASSRHAVRLGIEAGRETTYPFGTSQPEMIRRLESVHGTQGRHNILASMGMKQSAASLPGEFFGEQVLSPQDQWRSVAGNLIKGERVYSPFEARLHELMAQSAERANRSAASFSKQAASPSFRTNLSNKWRDSLAAFVDDIVMRNLPGSSTALVRQQGSKLQDILKDVVTQSCQEAGTGKVGRVPEFSSPEHLQRMLGVFQGKLNRLIESGAIGRIPLPPKARDEIIEALERVKREFPSQFAKENARELAKGLPKLREVSGLTKTAVKGREGLLRVAEPVRKALERSGRQAPKNVPMWLVAAIGAGLLATGMSSGEEAA
jgi:hypothetical protein